jgi:hypothetical protein
MTPETPAKKPRRPQKVREARTLSITQIPADVKLIIQRHRKFEETWQETIFRLVKVANRL